MLLAVQPLTVKRRRLVRDILCCYFLSTIAVTSTSISISG
jgi:hypothetical protein